ncbi:MAG: hypothetical protein HQM08_09735 [Candidatus Riflebacteria bacterium]|nr:hypothetical protein [Candidatus Riflebacteria bacterium]
MNMYKIRKLTLCIFSFFLFCSFACDAATSTVQLNDSSSSSDSVSSAAVTNLGPVEFEFTYDRVVSATKQEGNTVSTGDNLSTATFLTAIETSASITNSIASESVQNNDTSTKVTAWKGLRSGRNYTVEETKVKTRAELLKLMDVTSESDLSKGQKALLAAFDFAHSEAMKKRLSLAEKCNVPDNLIGISLIDTTFVQSIPNEDLASDFWPCCAGTTVFLSSAYAQNYSTAHLETTLSHEVSHALDRVPLPYPSGYSQNGMHYSNQKTTPVTALKEGWAEFNEFLDFPETFQRPSEIYREMPLLHNGYEYVHLNSPDLSGEDLLAVEGIDAALLFDLSKKLPDGKKKIFDTFVKLNHGATRSMVDFINSMASDYPSDVKEIFNTLDIYTECKFSDEDLKRLFPTAPTGSSRQHKYKQANASETAAIVVSTSLVVSATSGLGSGTIPNWGTATPSYSEISSTTENLSSGTTTFYSVGTYSTSAPQVASDAQGEIQKGFMGQFQ